MPLARLLFYFSTAAVLALTVGAFVYEPPPVWVPVTVGIAYLGLLFAGVWFAGFSMFADVVTLGPKNARGVALTFDDGPDPRSTPKILDLLDAAGAKATFFVIGRKAEKHPALVREIFERGHAVGIHSFAHDRFFAFRSPRHVKRDLSRALELVHEITGVRPRLFRAPIGPVSPSMARVVRQLDLQAIGWSLRSLDGWSTAKPESVAARVARRLRDGVIVLLHDASERGDFIPASLEALPDIFEAAEAKQLIFVRVDNWLSGDPDAEDEPD